MLSTDSFVTVTMTSSLFLPFSVKISTATIVATSFVATVGSTRSSIRVPYKNCSSSMQYATIALPEMMPGSSGTSSASSAKTQEGTHAEKTIKNAKTPIDKLYVSVPGEFSMVLTKEHTSAFARKKRIKKLSLKRKFQGQLFGLSKLP